MFRIFNSLLVVLLPLLVVISVDTSSVLQSAYDGNEETYLQVVKEAEAKSKAKEWNEAATLWERATEMNPTLGSNWVQYANALYESKQYRKAITAYEKWNELGVSYPWDSTYSIACNYALLGEKQKALEYLEKALNQGYRDLKQAQTDADFESIRNDPKYRELVALVDTSKMTRIEGWRYDLKFLVREVKRIHYDPYRKVSQTEFDAFVRRLNLDIPKLTDQQITVGMMKIMRMLGDGHSAIRNVPLSKNKMLPVQFYYFTEGLYIMAAAPEQKDLVGAQVLKIGDKTVDEVTAELDLIISQDNKMWIKQMAPRYLRIPLAMNGLGLIPNADRVVITIRDTAGKTRTVELTGNSDQPTEQWINSRAGATNPEPLYLKNRMTNYWYEYLPESKTVYCQYNAVVNAKEESIEAFYERLFKFINENDVERLVIDMRWNGGGNLFNNRPLINGLISNPKINQRGKLFVIVGRNTFSAAMNGVAQINKHTRAIFVGEPTGSSPNFVGETIAFELPYSKITGSISDLFWQGTFAMDYRTWIAPEIYAPPSFEFFKTNRDPAMEAISSYIQSK